MAEGKPQHDFGVGSGLEGRMVGVGLVKKSGQDRIPE
jgi:hypothetical protein